MNNKTLAIIFVFCMIFAFVMGAYDSLWKENVKIKEDLSYYQTNYLRKVGGTSLWKGSHGKSIDYDLRSFDGGKNWYVINHTNNNVIVEGNVNNIYPGLVEQLDSEDKLFEYVEKHVPLNLSNSHDQQLLEDSGFDVITNSNQK